jgi:hypothetical protein
MDIEALLCDAAKARDGLLFVIGGGINRVARPQYPAPLNCDLALMITMHPAEMTERHRLRVMVQGEDGLRIAEVEAEFGFGVEGAPPPIQKVSSPLILGLAALPLPAPGHYSLEVLFDGQLVRSLPVEAVLSSTEQEG